MSALTRRSLLRGLIAAPAVVSVASLMPVKLWVPETPALVPVGPVAWPGWWALGDIVIAPHPRDLSRLMFVCVEAGSPGVWKPFGALA